MKMQPEHQSVMFYFTKLMDPSREAEYHQWYLDTHIPDVMQTSELLAYHRFVSTRDGDDDRKYVVIVECDSADVDDVTQKMSDRFGHHGDKEKLRKLITEGRLINYGKSTWSANLRRIFRAEA